MNRKERTGKPVCIMNMSKMNSISLEMIQRFNQAYDADKTAKVMTGAASRHELSDLAFIPEKAARLENCFSIELKTREVTSQEASGRCWLFASMNIMREKVAEKCNLDMFELSGNYFAFWDKFEKINYFLETIIDCADLPVGDRTLNWVLNSVGDGGQWDMMVSLIQKYGIVPKTVMPETFQSLNTRQIMSMINTKLRKDAIELRKIVTSGADPQPRKEEMLCEFYKLLCTCFGKPTEKFDFQYKDADGQFHVDYDLTPLSFYEKYVGVDLSEYVSIINAPTQDKPYGRTYTVKYLGNVAEGSVRYLNLTMDEMKDLMVQQMKDGEIVWFGSDCGKSGDKKEGIWDPDSFDYQAAFGLDLSMSKEDQLDYLNSAMNHAMVLTGVNLDRDGKPNRWKIENSWGEKNGKKGYYIGSDAWVDQYVFQAIIKKKYLTEDMKKALEQEPVVLDPWDPMGTLA